MELFLLYYILYMGCITTEKKKEQRLTITDYHLIWKKCLKLQSVTPHQTKAVYHPVFVQIEKDIERTYPDVPQFNNPEAKDGFKNILRKFALEFPKVGYTQGLNFVAGQFVINSFDENQTLKSLIALCTNQNLMLLGLYQDQFPLCKLYCELFWLVLKEINEQIYKALKEANFPDQLWIFQWFITLFTYTLPLSYCKEIFNFIIIKGQFAPVRLAIGIIQSLQKNLRLPSLKDQSFIQCLQLMKTQQFCRNYLPIDGILKRAQKIKHSTLLIHLQNCQTSNFYKYYFLCAPPFRQKKHKRFLQDLQIQRNRFQKQIDFSNNSRYTRELSSIKIIQFIQQTRIKRYSRLMSRSSKDKQMVFFSNLTLKRYNSLQNIENS